MYDHKLWIIFFLFLLFFSHVLLLGKKNKLQKLNDVDDLLDNPTIVSIIRKTRSFAQQATSPQTAKVTQFDFLSLCYDVIIIYSLIFRL